MSEENVELVRKMCEAFLAADVGRALAVLDHGVAWHGTIGGLEEGQIARGHKEVIDGFSESLREWESMSLKCSGSSTLVTAWSPSGTRRAVGGAAGRR